MNSNVFKMKSFCWFCEKENPPQNFLRRKNALQKSINSIQCLLDVSEDVLNVFDAYRETDQIRRNTSGLQFFLVHLTVGAAGGMENAGLGICHMGGDGGQLQILHEGFSSSTSALDTEGHDAAAALGQVLLGQIVVFVAGQAAVVDPGHLGMLVQEFGHSLTIFRMADHPEMQAFQTQIQEESVLGRLDGAEVPHELCGCFGDIGAFQTEALGIGDAVIAFIGVVRPGNLSAWAFQSNLPLSTMQPPTAAA